MKAAEKLLQDIAYWQEQEREARETLRISETVLPGLRKSLQVLKEEEVAQASIADLEASLNAAERASVRGAELSSIYDLRLRGQCEDQVEQALEVKSPQSPADLTTYLAKHGTDYSRGAINYAIRKLRRQGAIREAKKEGNLRFYELAREDSQ